MREALAAAERERDEARRAWREAQWQPIETAPKDGTQILGFCADAAAGREFWVVLWVEDEEYPDGGFWLDASKQDSMTVDAEPTHWVPLPAPPPTEDAAAHAAKDLNGE